MLISSRNKAQSCCEYNLEYHTGKRSGNHSDQSDWTESLEPVCSNKRQKSPNQETGLGNRGRLKVLNDTKLVLNGHEWSPYQLGSIWDHLEPSDFPYSQKHQHGSNSILTLHELPKNVMTNLGKSVNIRK